PSEAARSRAWNVLSASGLVALVLGSGWALRAWFRWEARQGTGSPLHFAKTVGYLVGPALGLAFVVGALRRARERECFVPVVATALALGAAGLASFLVRVSAQYVFVLLPWIAAGAALAVVPGAGARETLATRVRF